MRLSQHPHGNHQVFHGMLPNRPNKEMKQRRKPYIIHQTQSVSYLSILSYLDPLKHLAQPEILLHRLIILLLVVVVRTQGGS